MRRIAKSFPKLFILVCLLAVNAVPVAHAQAPSDERPQVDIPQFDSGSLLPPEENSESLLDNINQEIKLEKKIENMDTRIETARAAIPELQVAIDQREATLVGINQALAREKRAYSRIDRRLTRVTARFIDLTQSIEAGKQRPQDDEGQLFQYMAESNLGDAVLVYQLGSLLLDRQGTALAQVRKVAARAYRAQQKVLAVRAQKNQALAGTREDLQVAEEDVQQLEKERDDLQEKLKRLRDRGLGDVAGAEQSNNSPFVPDLLDDFPLPLQDE